MYKRQDLYIYAMTTDGFKRAITSLLIDSSNHGYLYNVKKFRPFSIINGKGTCKILGFEMTDRTIKPATKRKQPYFKIRIPNHSQRTDEMSRNFTIPSSVHALLNAANSIIL